jgi:hypothetical protein
MNEKMQAILLGIVIHLKKMGWTPGPDWEITLKSEGHVPMIKLISVQGSVEDEDWDDNVETFINFKLESRDDITYFPYCTVYTNISVVGLEVKDIVHELGIDVAFTEKDIKNTRNIKNASSRTNDLVEEYIRQEYATYVDMNAQKIKLYNMGALADDDEDENVP